MTGLPHLFALLLAAHAAADGPLQPGWLAAAKRPGADVHLGWPEALGAHALAHGLLAGSALACAGVEPRLAAAIVALEAAAHGLIDFGKTRGRYGTAADQAMHIACQCAWALLASGGGLG